MGTAQPHKHRSRDYKGVTISSTFVDLKEHRQKLKAAIEAHHMHTIGFASRFNLRSRGQWAIDCEAWDEAVAVLEEGERLTRESAIPAWAWEVKLVLARLRRDRSARSNWARSEAERLDATRAGKDGEIGLSLAELWLALGERDRAIENARRGYLWAWADGEPFVYRYPLDQCKAFLERLGAPPPTSPETDKQRQAEKFPYEDEVTAAVRDLQRRKAAGEDLSKEA
jgi:hypothetical protein